MSTKGSSVAFVALLLLSTVPVMSSDLSRERTEPSRLGHPLFDGFFVGENENVWNETPWPSVAVPNGFSYGSLIDYADVGVLINNLSAESRTIGWAFVAARNISLDRVFLFNQTGTPTAETINRDQFNAYFALPFLEMLQNRSSSNQLNYLVTTKGIPLRVSGGNDKASFDQELALLGGSYNSSIGGDYWFNHDYGPLAGKPMESFTRTKYGFFLVTRLTGYTVDTALELIERANQSLGQRGNFVLDLATNRNSSGYKFWNDNLYTANTTLNGSMGLPVLFDEESEFITNISNVIGYASWGSNDGDWYANYLPNSGFDTLDSTWQSGSKYWTHTSPNIVPEDDFEWVYQTAEKQGGNGAFEASLRTACEQDSGEMMQGIYGEYFDNAGLSINAATMPTLIDRIPDRVQIEPDLNHGASNNAYLGLDNRFKQDWGARFSGLIDIPASGNWTFFINSDDGSELWLDGVSLVQNHGMHGMTERSGFVNLTAGLHDFRIEFFQGGGPHGLIFSWQGPNTSKVSVPASAFYVSGDLVPQASRLIHHWEFEEGAGSQANDSANGGANFTLYGMNSSNWQTCVDGSCLWFDGVNDEVKVDVNDWTGNLTVSQWVWANTTNQTTYAATFAVDDQAGSNLSFQHMVSGGQWRMHNNQTHSFGNVVAQRWTHLVSVFDDGDIRQYMDGVLVNTNTYPNGSFNNIDLYKLGVNRAGNAYFEGKIDEVLVWNVALDDQDITSLRRNIIDNCSVYSGAGVDVAHLETTFTLPANLPGHAWMAYVYGKRVGEVDGAFALKISAMDGNGTVLSINTSSDRTFTTAWASEFLRFRPDAQATQFKVEIPLDIASTSRSGAFYIDTVLIRAIRPHMDWVNGSIADTAVSTGGRSFNWGTSYGQSLVADLLEDGVSGVKGYVYEPYLTAVGLPSMYLPLYASGYNLAESHAAANRLSGWMGVVVGDPKMAPYADIFHDINIVDVRVLGPMNLGEPATVQVLIENTGMSPSNGTLLVQTVLGNTVLNQTNVVLPAGNLPGSRTVLNLSVVPASEGYLDLRIRYDNITHERNFANNLFPFSVIVNGPPSIQQVYCSASAVTRGAYTICSVKATDDVNVTMATLEWQILSENQSINDENWSLINLGQINPETWEASLVVPSNASLGWITLRATVHDASNMRDQRIYANVTRVVDSPPTWFGPHLKGVDPTGWNNASHLPNRPTTGLFRHQPSQLTACVLDADYRVDDGAPFFLASRGTIGNLTYIPQSTAHLYCYTASFSLSVGSSLQDVVFELRSAEGSLLLQRTIRVADMAPQLHLQVESTSGRVLDRVVGNGAEVLRILVEDVDDPGTSVVGDVMVQWPGGETIQLPLDIPAGQNNTSVNLEQLNIPLEAGELFIEVSGIGQHGSSTIAQLNLPFFLTPPEILFIEACDSQGAVENMTFGQTAILVVGVASDRPIEGASSQLTQQKWSINAPSTNTLLWPVEQPPEACNWSGALAEGLVRLTYRLKLDNSMIDGPGKAVFSISDIDGLTKSASIDLMFQHAPTEFISVELSTPSPGRDLYTNVTLSDLDGLDRVICSYTLLNEDGGMLSQLTMMAGPEGVFVNQLTWQYPIPGSLANSTLNLTINCVDDLQQNFAYEHDVVVGPAVACTTCSSNPPRDDAPSSSPNMQSAILKVSAVVAILIVGLSAVVLRLRKTMAEETEWGEQDASQMASLEDLFDQDSTETSFEAENILPTFVPDGWTIEAYQAWLEGPAPEGWTDEQWSIYVAEHREALAQHHREAQG
jgi:uncharacterized protein (TIGR03790 family)